MFISKATIERQPNLTILAPKESAEEQRKATK